MWCCKGLHVQLGRFFGGVCVASIFFGDSAFEKKITPKWHEKSTKKKPKRNGLTGWGGGGCLPGLWRDFAIQTDFWSTFFYPGGLKSLFSKTC
jgi:hypothetical protein